MTANVGRTDRLVRIAAAVLLVLLALVLLGGAGRWLTLGVAAVLAGTAFVGTCPLYLPFGLSTRRKAGP